MKKNLTRRTFIKSSAYATLAAGVTSTLGCGSDDGTGSGLFTFVSRKQAVVIGSGFGGSVAALRLGEAGLSTALIERGQHWMYSGENSFPTLADLAQGDERTTWLGEVDAATGQIPLSRYTGMMERITGDTVDSVVGAGLGGGSLVYGGVLLQPRQELFEQVFPYIDYADMDSIYYPRVLNLVSGGSIPDDILNHDNYTSKRSFITNAGNAGLTVVKGHVGFDWNVIRQELNGDIGAFASTGDYVFCCNSNAKNTLDKNYITAAVQTGNVEVNTLHNVVAVAENGDGEYKIHCEVLTEAGEVLYNHVFYCRYVFMAAGSINTSKILLKAQASGDLTGLNDQIGQNWAANGDDLMARMGVTSPLGPVQGGPPSIAAWDFANSIKPVGFMHSPSSTSSQFGQPTQMQLGMCVSDQLGSISYDPATDKPFIHWSLEANTPSHNARMEGLQKITNQSGGLTLAYPQLGGRPTMWHPLGGATMGQATSDQTGELMGQSNMFVVDGALMPGSTAVANPSLTIAANAERIMENILASIL